MQFSKINKQCNLISGRRQKHSHKPRAIIKQAALSFNHTYQCREKTKSEIKTEDRGSERQIQLTITSSSSGEENKDTALINQ
jgi:hypothetical protein